MLNSVSAYWGIASLLIVLLNVHIVGGIFSIGKLRAPQSAQNGHNPVPLFVMLQLDTFDPATNRLKDPDGLKYQLLELQRLCLSSVWIMCKLQCKNRFAHTMLSEQSQFKHALIHSAPSHNKEVKDENSARHRIAVHMH